jgi:hypothetical protein
MVFPLVLATHLYTAVVKSPSFCRQAQVERFTFVNNRLTKQPDLRFPTMRNPLATDGKGNLYAQLCQDSPFTFGYIYVFPPGSTKPSRIIRLPQGGSQPDVFADAMTLDSAGNLFVAFENYLGRHIAVYPPGARKPSLIFGQFADALAVDAYGALYASAGTGTIDVYANPTRRPRLVHTLSAWADALLIDSYEVYTCCTAVSVVVYNNWEPIRVITPRQHNAFKPALAVAPNTFLYTLYNFGNIVVGFPKWTDRTPTILDSVQLDAPASALTIGL